MSSSFWTMSNFFSTDHGYLSVGSNILTGTEMEAVAYGDQTMRFDRLLRVGECYDFMRVGFVLTHVGPSDYIFRLCADYFVVLSPKSMANVPPREL